MPKPKTLTRSTEFRAVDLDVRSRKSLAPLLSAWPWVQTPERTTSAAPRWLLVTLRSQPRTADDAIRAFVEMVEALPPSARRCWRQATSRTFDIGIQAGLAPILVRECPLADEDHSSCRAGRRKPLSNNLRAERHSQADRKGPLGSLFRCSHGTAIGYEPSRRS